MNGSLVHVQLPDKRIVIDIDKLLGIKGIVTMKVAFELLLRAGTDGSLVLLPADRVQIHTKLNIWPQQITAALTELRELGIITGYRNEFQVAKEIFNG